MALRGSRIRLLLCSCGLIGVTSAAQAATYSFASDDDSGAFTLRGTPNGNAFTITNGRPTPFTPVTLKLDDDNMSQPTISIAAGLIANLNATYAGSVGVGDQTHVYNVTGTFMFVKASDSSQLLTVTVNAGSTLTIGGTSSSWSSVGSIFGSDAAGGQPAITYNDLGIQQHLIGLAINPFDYGLWFGNVNEDFGFSMTLVNASGGPVALDANHIPTGVWQSESSFSGHSVGVPTPGAAAGLAVGGLVGFRRRRR